MAQYNGSIGAVYNAAYIRTTTISFHENDPSADTIEDSGDGFVVAGFDDDDEITVSGSDDNDGDYTIDTVAAGVLTLDSGDDLADESAGDDVIIYKKAPGTQTAGFAGWELNDGVAVVDVTDFDSGGEREFMTTITDWTATANKYWDTVQHDSDILGIPQIFRFFVVYQASPSGGSPAIYYEGLGILTSAPVNIPVGEMVQQRITIQGCGALTLVTKTSAW